MANVGDLVVHIKGDSASLDNALNRSSDRMKKMGGQFRSIGKKMMLGVTMPILGIAGSAIHTAAQFEKSMNRVSALSGATGKDLDALRDQSRELGRTTMFAATEAAEAQGFLAMAGFETNEILGAMPSILNLAAAGQLDIARTADIASNIMSGYSLTTEELGHANDVLAKAMTSANVDMEMLGESMKMVAPIASSAGMGFESVTAAIALMGNAGIQGTMAGTSLRFAIGSLLDPVDDVAKELKRLGIVVKDSEGNLIPFVEIVEQLENSGANTSSMLKIFGQRAGAGMSAIVGQGTEALRAMEQSLMDAGGTAKEVADIQMRGLSGEMREFTSAMEGAKIEMGNELLPLLTDLLNDHLTPLIQAFSELDEETKKFIVFGLIIGAAIAPLMIMISMLMPLLIFLVANPIGVAILGIGLAIAAVIVWMNNWEENIRVLNKLWDDFDYKMRNIFGAENWDRIKKIVAAPMLALVDSIQGVIDVFQGLWDLVNGDWSAAMEHFKDAGQHFLDAFMHMWDEIKAKFGFGKDIFLILMDTLGKVIFGEDFWEKIKENFMSGKDKIFNYFSEFVDKMTTFWGNMWGALMDLLSGNIDGAIQHLKDATDVLIEGLNEAIGGINKINPFKHIPTVKTFAERDKERNYREGQLGTEETFGARGIGSQLVHSMNMMDRFGSDYFASKEGWARNYGRPAPDGVNVTVNMTGDTYGMDDFDAKVSEAIKGGIQRGGFQGVID